MEAARALPFLREGGRIVVNSQKIEPVTVKMLAGGVLIILGLLLSQKA